MIESQTESLNFIGGEWVPADSGETSQIVNPSKPTEVLGTTPNSGMRETESAIEAAAKALPEWKATMASARGAILLKAADIVEGRVEELARLMALEAGKPMKEGRAAVFLASSAADFVHGTILPVDGGWLGR